MTLADKINEALDAGKAVTIATYLRSVRVTAKNRAVWRAVGYEFFKTDSTGATLMIDGQSNGKPRYACIDGTKITAA
ncbi:MAG: hypothetical protein ACO377_14345 [Pseudomonadales bacterium]|jgi:hypothetical protein